MQTFSLILRAVSRVWWLFFAVQKLFSLMQSHLFIVTLRCWAFWVLFKKLFPIPICSMYFLLLLGIVSKFQVLYSGLWSTLSSFWYSEKDRDLISVFHMQISSFASSICWRSYVFSIMCFVLGFWRSVGYMHGFISGSSVLIHWSSCFPVNTMLFLLWWLCRIVWS
jgi:hypothetical protein